MSLSNEIQNHVVGFRDQSLPPLAQMRNDSNPTQKGAEFRQNAYDRSGLSHRTQMMRSRFKEGASEDLSSFLLGAEKITALTIPTLEPFKTAESDSRVPQALQAQSAVVLSTSQISTHKRTAKDKDSISNIFDVCTNTWRSPRIREREPKVELLAPTISSDHDVIEVDTSLLKKIASMQSQRVRQFAGKRFWSLPIFHNPTPAMSAVVLSTSKTSPDKRTAKDKDLGSNLVDVLTGWWKRHINPSEDPEKREQQKRQFRNDKDVTTEKVIKIVVDEIYEQTKEKIKESFK